MNNPYVWRLFLEQLQGLTKYRNKENVVYRVRHILETFVKYDQILIFQKFLEYVVLYIHHFSVLCHPLKMRQGLARIMSDFLVQFRNCWANDKIIESFCDQCFGFRDLGSLSPHSRRSRVANIIL